MIEMQMENQRVERQRLQRLGEDWIRAITEGALERLEGLCQAGVASQVLTPKTFAALDSAADLVGKFRQWFGECSDFHIEKSRVGMIGERLGIFYAFLLQEQGGRYAVEQQLYCTLQEGRVARLQLLCSGFHPVDDSSRPSGADEIGQPGGGAPEDGNPEADALLELRTGAENSGSICALLTPAIKAKLREMESGKVLEVRVDDASARGDIEAWCRLSGNALVKMTQATNTELRLFVRKK